MILRSNGNEEKQNLLIQKYLNDCGIIPNQEEEHKREDIIQEIKKIISLFVQKFKIENSNEKKEGLDFIIYPSGSYALGVYQNHSDLDLYFSKN